MKRTTNKSKANKSSKPVQEPALLTKVKLVHKKSLEHTASTLGSRSSMESKNMHKMKNPIKISKFAQVEIDNLKQRASYAEGQADQANVFTKKATNVHKSKRTANSHNKFTIPLLENHDNMGTNADRANQGMISYREYCVVGDRWVPMLTPTQRQRLMNPIVNSILKHATIDTAYDLNQITTTPDTNAQDISNKILVQTPNKLRCINENQSFQDESMNKIKINETARSIEQQKQSKNIQHIECGNSKISFTLQRLKKQMECIKPSQQELQREFQSLDQKDKQGLIEVLQNVVQKLTASTKNVIEKPTQVKINSQLDHKQARVRKVQQNVVESTDCVQNSTNDKFEDDLSPVKLFHLDCQQFQLTCHDNIPLSIQSLISIRQQSQLSIFPPRYSPNSSSPYAFDTSLHSLQTYINRLIQTIEQTNLQAEIVTNLKLAYGFPKKQKLMKIRKSMYLGSHDQPMNDYVFQLIQDNWQPQQQKQNQSQIDNKSAQSGQMYKFIYNKCLFDAINHQLSKLKPFYLSMGETYPWSIKSSPPLTFYQIQQSSLPIVFDEIKVKIIQDLSCLCGIIVQKQHPLTNRHFENNQIKRNSINGNDNNNNSYTRYSIMSDEDYQTIAKRRLQSQDNMMRKQIQRQIYKQQYDNNIQNQATLIMMAISDQILISLMEEIGAPFI